MTENEMTNDPDDYRLTSTGLGFSFIKKSRAVTNPQRHFHVWWEILYIESGERTFFYANRTLHITAGTFIIIAPGILHRALNPPDEVCSLYNIYFGEGTKALGKDSLPFNMLLPVLEKCDSCIGLLPAVQNQVTDLFARLGEELIGKQNGYEAMAWSLIGEILVTVSRQKAERGIAMQPTSEMNGHIAAVIDYLNTHYSEEVTLGSTARRFGLSESHLSRTFKSATHFGFVEYVNSLRITKSCRFLSDTKKPVTEIAFECGFGSVTQFGRCFRELTGKSPREYRR
jgi:AraC-like DNA-binding protein/mannose-6-phosphate isomerase-like protein (cupin superfamily)